MNLLLDTHILIWALNEDPRLPAKAKDLILDENNSVYYSVVSLWEVSIKHAGHPDNVKFTGKELSEFCREAGFLSLEMRDRHVFALETVKRASGAPLHNDPFDRMLIAQAKAEKMSFITHDSLLPYYSEDCITPV
ncbi:MAG: type II toxin-antitoxin system VapC family toxin [Lachnospiraceae bacterium]|nr:type II toxin-antitoxin system VapC family toxin [Lachnospiraceae bacterium]